MTQADTDDTRSLVSEGMSEIEREFVELWEQGKVAMPGEVLNQEDPDVAEASDEDEGDVEGAVADAQSDDETDEESDTDAAEDAQADDEADASTDESGDGESEDGAAGDAEEEPVTADDAVTVYVPDAPLKIGDREFQPAEVVDMQRAYEWSQTLAPENVAAINALFSGEYELVPVGEKPAAPVAQPTTTSTDDEDYEPLDPVAADRIAKMEQELDLLRNQSATTAQERQIAQVSAGVEAFNTARELDEATSNRLQKTVLDNGWMPLFVQQTGGDFTRATEAALEFAAQNDPILRQAEIDRLATEQFERDRRASDDTRTKKRKAGSLGGGGGSVSRKVRQPSTKEEMDAAMVSEIASALGSGQEA